MIGFAFPWLLLGALVALPSLYLMYKLRQRSRRKQVVSSLFLWVHIQESKEGGRRIQRFQTSTFFWLELCILCLLLLAAADPYVSLKHNRGPLMIVLDDSFSMQAGGSRSPHRQAEAFLQQTLRAGDYSFVRLIGAGAVPRLLGGVIQDAAQAKPWIAQWQALSPQAQLSKAIALAWQLGGARARVLVLTDHPPPHKIAPKRVVWKAFGVPRRNAAIVYASRSRIDQKDWCLLEVAHFGTKPREVRVEIELEGQSPAAKVLKMKPGERRRLRFSIPSARLTARLGGDGLAVDDQITLLPREVRPLRVRLDLPASGHRELWRKSLLATKSAVLVTRAPQLWITQKPALVAPGPDAWGVHIPAESGEVGYRGPFVLNRNHILTRGLSLQGVIWGAGKGTKSPGLPVLTAGDVPLLSEATRSDGGRSLQIRWKPQISTLALTPNWPILVWNVLDWRRKHQPGLEQRNLRLGSAATLVTPEDVATIQVTPPKGKPFSLTVIERQVRIDASQTGRYSLKAGASTFGFVVNALSPSESDLRKAGQGSWGSWPPRHKRGQATHRIAWLLLLLALLLLSFHLRALAAQRTKV